MLVWLHASIVRGTYVWKWTNRTLLQENPTAPFTNFRASWSGDRRILCSSGASWDEFWSSNVVKGSVRKLSPLRPTKRFTVSEPQNPQISKFSTVHNSQSTDLGLWNCGMFGWVLGFLISYSVCIFHICLEIRFVGRSFQAARYLSLHANSAWCHSRFGKLNEKWNLLHFLTARNLSNFPDFFVDKFTCNIPRRLICALLIPKQIETFRKLHDLRNRRD